MVIFTYLAQCKPSGLGQGGAIYQSKQAGCPKIYFFICLSIFHLNSLHLIGAMEDLRIQRLDAVKAI